MITSVNEYFEYIQDDATNHDKAFAAALNWRRYGSIPPTAESENVRMH